MQDAEAWLEFACEAAWRAGRQTLAHFGNDPEVERKADGTEVTVADREGERLLRGWIAGSFPDHGIVGEELGVHEGDGEHVWYLDPIDGTRAFVSGVPLFAVLIGLAVRGEPVVGVAYFPALDELVAAGLGSGCTLNGRRVVVTEVADLDQARVVYTECDNLQDSHPERWAAIRRATASQRGWGDAYGHCLVASGRAEIALDPIVLPWDVAALIPIVRESGGRISAWDGEAGVDAGSAVSTNAALHEATLGLLRG